MTKPNLPAVPLNLPFDTYNALSGLAWHFGYRLSDGDGDVAAFLVAIGDGKFSLSPTLELAAKMTLTLIPLPK